MSKNKERGELEKATLIKVREILLRKILPENTVPIWISAFAEMTMTDFILLPFRFILALFAVLPATAGI